MGNIKIDKNVPIRYYIHLQDHCAQEFDSISVEKIPSGSVDENISLLNIFFYFVGFEYTLYNRILENFAHPL